MVKFFEENKRVREACHYMEESFREAAAAMWEQANKIDKLKMENAKLKRENEQLKRENEQLKKTDADMTKPQPCTKYRDAERMAWMFCSMSIPSVWSMTTACLRPRSSFLAM